MKLDDLKQQIAENLDLDIPMYLWGPPGIGKSEIVHQVAKELGYEVIDIRLSQIDAVDLRGVPFVEKGENGDVPRTCWAPPEFLPKPGCKPTIMFWDEMNHGQPDTLSATFQMIQERRIGNYEFPANVRHVAAGNRAKDKSIANHLPSALRNRFMHFEVESNADAWRKWALTQKYSEALLSFIAFDKASLNEFEERGDSSDERQRLSLVKQSNAFATPRSWSFVNKILKQAEKAGTPIRSKRAAIEACVGKTTASKLIGYVENIQNMPSMKDILKDPENAPLPKKAEVRYAICTMLANNTNEKNFNLVYKYMARLEAEFQVMLLKDLISTAPEIIGTDEYDKWVEQYQELIF